MNTKILLVDDDPHILSAFQRNLRKQFELEIAPGAPAALALIDQAGPFAVIVADMQMPGMNGIDFLIQAEARHPDTVRIMLTGNADQKTAKDAVNEGHIFRFLTKPCAVEDLAQSLEAGLKQYRLITAERELLEKTLTGTVKLLTEILARADPLSFGLGQKTRDYMHRFLQRFPCAQAWELEVAAELVHIGYVTLPPALLTKSSQGNPLSGPEKDLLARVPELGADLLQNIPRLESVAQILRYQQKNYDGTGLPANSVCGEEIPIGARILRVLSEVVRGDTQGISRFRAFELMQKQCGHYDPRVLSAVGACFDVCPTPTAPASAPAQPSGAPITVKEIKPGQVLARDVETIDGMMIVAADTALTPLMLQRLRNFAQLGNLKQPLWVY
jgi:response regulator RpfG family c-di-GMP phosphodiesterase